MLYHSHYILEEKSAAIQMLKTQMENNSSDFKTALEAKDQGKIELESDYKKQVLDDGYAHKLRIKEIEDEYFAVFRKKDKQIIQARFEARLKARDLTSRHADLRQEAVNLFEIARLQGKAIYDIETGRYNKGISPVLIPRNQIPPIPNESKFPIIFSALGSQALEVARISAKVKSQFSYVPSKTNTSTSRTSFFKEPEKTMSIETSISTLMDTPLDLIKINELRSIGNSLQRIIKQNAEKVAEVYRRKCGDEQEVLLLEAELETAVLEKEKYQEGYTREVRRRMDEDDKETERCGAKAFMTELLTRPNTYRNVYTSSKMMRNIHTTISANRLPLSISPSVKFETMRPSTTAIPFFNGGKHGRPCR